jgi:hypothetical protein
MLLLDFRSWALKMSAWLSAIATLMALRQGFWTNFSITIS